MLVKCKNCKVILEGFRKTSSKTNNQQVGDVSESQALIVNTVYGIVFGDPMQKLVSTLGPDLFH